MSKHTETPSNMTVQKRPRGPMGGPMGSMGGGGEKAKNFKAGFRRLLTYMKPFRIQFAFVFIFAIISTVFMIVGPKILAKATDVLATGLMSMFGGKESSFDFDYIANIILWLIGLYVISMIFSYLQGHIMAGISTKVAYNLRNELMKKMNHLPFSYYNKTSHGEVLSRITNDVDTLNMTLNQSVTQMITSVTSVIGVLIMMMTISVKLTLLSLLIIPFSMIFVVMIVKKSQKYFKGQQVFLGHVNGHIEEMYGGHIVMKAFNGEEKSLELFDKQNDKLYESAWKSQFLTGLMMPIFSFVGNIGYVVICIVGASMTANGTMTIGGIQAFIQYVRSFTQPLMQLANISSQFQQMVAAAERVFEFLDVEEEKVTTPKLTMLDTEIKGDVSFDHIRFGYENTEQIVIKDFSVSVKAGQKVAIVGPTGAGKTTLVKLLMRFHDLHSGAIYVDGHNIEDFTRSDLRTRFGMVLQDTWLYNGSIMDNIRYGRLDATDDEVIKAAKAAQVDHFVRTLPDGYHMELNEEATNISQGQKQLLTIARAVLADSKILILDEATSSVDTRTEILIQKAMDNLMKGRTSFIIAHRLSTIRNADVILCMKEGDIVEQGSHDELMKLDGFYANLYNSQFEKGIAD
jgi:ATP-binding cassette subfamily B protein